MSLEVDDVALSARALHSWTLDALHYQTPEARHAIQMLIGGFSFHHFSEAMRTGVLYPQPFLDDDGELKVALQILTDDGMTPFATLGIDWCGPGLERIFRAHFEHDSEQFASEIFGSDDNV